MEVPLVAGAVEEEEERRFHWHRSIGDELTPGVPVWSSACSQVEESAAAAKMIFGGSKYGVGDDLLEVFVFHCALLQLKMLAMPVLTSVQRQTKKVTTETDRAPTFFFSFPYV